MLTVSVWEPIVPYYKAYAIGELVDGRFIAESWGRLSYGPSYYAGAAFADKDGERGLIYWMRDVDDPSGAWASAHSLPHRLTIQGDRVVAAPPPEVAAARTGQASTTRAGMVEVPWVVDLEWLLDTPGSEARWLPPAPAVLRCVSTHTAPSSPQRSATRPGPCPLSTQPSAS